MKAKLGSFSNTQSKMITLTTDEWTKLSIQLTEDFGRSVMLMRSKSKEILGFTVRFGTYDNWPDRNVYLDFFDDSKETWFRMKYL